MPEILEQIKNETLQIFKPVGDGMQLRCGPGARDQLVNALHQAGREDWV